MLLRKKLTIGLLSVVTALALMTSPTAQALEVDFDFGVNDPDATDHGGVTDEMCANLDENLAAAAGCDTSDSIIDLTRFEGGLDAPDGSGLDPSLTQSDNARDFILTIVNFALSFLGLAATLVVIYGGVLYVMSRGDEEMATKGKKSISYAVVGIVIILGSFAFVNTVLQAGGGRDGSGGTQGGVTITEAGGSFDVDGVVAELSDITQEYIDTYETFLNVRSEVFYLKSIEMPLVVNITQTDITLDGVFDFLDGLGQGDSDYSDQYDLVDIEDIDRYLADLRQGLQRIQRQVDNLTRVYETSQQLYDYIRSGATSSKNFSNLLANLGLIPNAEATNPDIETQTSGPKCADREYSDTDYFDIGLGVTLYETELSNLDDAICGYLKNIEDAADEDYRNQVTALVERFDAMRGLFDTEGGKDTGSSLYQVLKKFEEAEIALNSVKEQVNVNSTVDVVEAMDALIKSVQELQFVTVRMTASTVEGNAPLLVRFDMLGTEDPSGLTVTDDQIRWDPFGHGIFSNDAIVIPNETGELISKTAADSVSVRYDKPGTYRARVQVLSSDPDIAAGLATIPIIVHPPKSKIILKAGKEQTVLADQTQFPVIDVSTYKVTATEAVEGEGIPFSLTGSVDGDGDPLVGVTWDFGDGVTQQGNFNSFANVAHKYGKEGRYEVSVQVTDKTGIVDKKYFSLFVASPAARISSSAKKGNVETEFTFDGSGSSADIGTIVKYQWTATTNNKVVDLGTQNRATAQFDQPGVYTVTLEVTDSTGVSDTASVLVLVESQTPIAQFSVSAPDQSKPGIRRFDASGSLDPDTEDTLSYEWDFDGTKGVDYIELEQENAGEIVTIQYLKVGTYNVTLTVKDQHLGELQKMAEISRAVAVDSVLDVDLQIVGDQARHLDDDGTVEVDFIASSEVGTAFEIDYGDGETEFTDVITNGQSRFIHTYDESGVFYVELTALDDENNSNSILKRIYVGEGDQPIAVINVTALNEDIGTGDVLTGSLNTRFTFDASESINVDGSNSNLSYSWNFGNGVVSNQSLVTHTYDETATFTVTLTVQDKSDDQASDQETVQIRIDDLPPKISGISALPSALITPAKVNVKVDAEDPDGEILFVKGWYYDVNNSAVPLGTVISQSTNFSLTVNTSGEEGANKTYGFAAEVTDNSNHTVSSLDVLDAANTPKLTFTNGSNDNPVANFTVDQTSVYVGEEITFSSTSYDPDGFIVSYEWDIGADGFFNDIPEQTATYTYTFNQVHPDGIPVRLRVTDNAGADAVSDTITIFVDSQTEPPEAAFLTEVDGLKVSFTDNSKIDTENGAEIQGVYWDFDLSDDSDGNGKPDDDFDSLDQETTHTYPVLGTYDVSYTVVDNMGLSDTVTRKISVLDTASPVADFEYTLNGKTVTFKDASTVDTENGVIIQTYEWDFDLGNGSDPVSAEADPVYTYRTYGTYNVKLSITDDHGKKSSVTKEVKVFDPSSPILAILTSVPLPNEAGQIVLPKPSGEVTFFFSSDGGSDNMEYTIDGNIFYDSNRDGIRENDVDFRATESGSWKVRYDQSFGQIVAQLTVTDLDSKAKDTVTLQVVFEGTILGANLFNITPSEMLLLILGAMLAAILGILMFFPQNKIAKRR